jgi:hypothetical protein
LKLATPQWIPTVFADRRAAWEGTFPEAPDIPIRVEAAAYRGRPVYFRIVTPWSQPLGAPAAETSLLTRITTALFGLLIVSILVGAVLLARRNVRLGRGDRKGAFRLATFVFVIGAISGLLQAHFVASFDQLDHLILFNAFPLFIAGMVFAYYLALEPHLRRLWPEMIVSWVRLLDGRFADPLVGRDVLIGVVFGLFIRIVDQTYQLSAQALGLAARLSDVSGGPPIDQILVGLTSARHAVSNFIAFSGASLLINLGLVVLVLLCRVLFRRTWLAVAIVLVLMSFIAGGRLGADSSASIAYALISWIVILLTLFRFGLLTFVVGHYVLLVVTAFPLTTHVDAWHSGRTLFVLVAVGCLAAYGFRVATANRTPARSMPS